MTIYQRYATFVDGAPPVYDTAAFLNGVQDGIVDAQTKAGDINPQTASYTLTIDDAGKVVEMTSASAMSLTVPPNGNVAFPVNTFVRVAQLGAGSVTLVAGAGVTLQSLAGTLTLAGQNSTVTLRKRATNTWQVVGDLTGTSTTDSVARQSIADHLADTVDAHDASAISFVPTGTLAATDVQAAVAEAASEATTASTAASTLAATKASLTLTTTSQSTSYTLTLSDATDRVIEFTGSSPQTLTVPPNSSVGIPIGTRIPVYQSGTGTVTIAPGGGVTIASNTADRTLTQGATVWLRKRGTDLWAMEVGAATSLPATATGNMGSAVTLTLTDRPTIWYRTLDQAACTLTVTGLAAGRRAFLLLTTVAGRTLSITDGVLSAVPLTLPDGTLIPIMIETDGTDVYAVVLAQSSTGTSGGASIPPATNLPLADGTAAVGTSTAYAREDHKHPTYIDVQSFTNAGFSATWFKPTAAVKIVTVVCVSGGGGGGSGRRGAAGTVRAGGGGGAGGNIEMTTMPMTFLGGTETVFVGGQGQGGAAVTVNDTNGNAGTNGGTTSFGAYARVQGGFGGAGGTATLGTAGGTGVGLRPGGAAGGSGGGQAGSQSAVNWNGTTGGGGGGGISAADVAFAGGIGSQPSVMAGGTVAGGVVDGTAPAAGGNAPADSGRPGGGAGGGAASVTTTAQTGAVGGVYGGGGGGGGASLNGNASGAGGNGGGGIVLVICY
jgi:hypothetical protein